MKIKKTLASVMLTVMMVAPVIGLLGASTALADRDDFGGGRGFGFGGLGGILGSALIANTLLGGLGLGYGGLYGGLVSPVYGGLVSPYVSPYAAPIVRTPLVAPVL